MANTPPGQPIAPGIATGNTYPQWGVKMTGSGSSLKGTTIEAKSQADKLKDENNGYLVWFSSQTAAQEFISSETSLLNGNIPNPLTWTLGGTNIAGWFVRGLKVLFGGILMILGVSHLTGLSNKLTQAAGTALPLLAA